MVCSELRLEPRRVGRVEIEVDYALQPRADAWLPTQMRESYGAGLGRTGGERIEAVAVYTDYRKGEVEVGFQPIR